MKILLFLVKGFETMEFSPFVDVMGWAENDYGVDITVVTCGLTRQVLSAFNIPVIVSKLFDEINIVDYDALAIPGGFEEFGFYEEAYDERFLSLIREFNVNVINEPIVVDRNVITSYCPETAPGVAFQLLEILTSKELVENVKQAMGFQ